MVVMAHGRMEVMVSYCIIFIATSIINTIIATTIIRTIIVTQTLLPMNFLNVTIFHQESSLPILASAQRTITTISAIVMKTNIVFFFARTIPAIKNWYFFYNPVFFAGTTTMTNNNNHNGLVVPEQF